MPHIILAATSQCDGMDLDESEHNAGTPMADLISRGWDRRVRQGQRSKSRGMMDYMRRAQKLAKALGKMPTVSQTSNAYPAVHSCKCRALHVAILSCLLIYSLTEPLCHYSYSCCPPVQMTAARGIGADKEVATSKPDKYRVDASIAPSGLGIV